MKRLLTVSKRMISAVLCLLLIAAGSTVAFAAEPGDDVISGTFTMVTFDGYDAGEQPYYYSDSYFSTSGKVSNAHLRTMSAALAFQILGTSDAYPDTYSAILDHIGFSDITAYDMDHTALDTMGVVLAHKNIDGKETVAVLLRGDKYEHEMAANMISGTDGDIKAFADAEALTESRVSAYLAAHGITSAKYWVTGYSRGGAVANLFGRELNRDPERFFTAPDDIYVYTIEAANGSADDTVYENIHNVIDRRDLITYVYPSAWGLYSNGVKEYIGGTDDTVMVKVFDLFSESHIADLEEMNLVTYLNDLIDFLSSNLSRETFSEKVGTPLSEILNIYYDLDQEHRDAVMPFFQQVFSELSQDEKMMMIVLSALADPTSQENIDALYGLIVQYLDHVAAESGKPVDDKSFTVIKSDLRPILEALLPLVNKDLLAEINHGDGTTPQLASMYHIMTLVGNLMPIFKNHFNYNVFNELKALDSYYGERKERLLGDANLDGVVDITDATAIQRYDVKMTELSETALQLADVDRDGDVCIVDTTYLQRYIVGMKAPDGIGEVV